jgi:hypothetical protein
MAHFNDHVVLSSKFDHEISYVGGGCPPIETDQGWLIISWCQGWSGWIHLFGMRCFTGFRRS